MKLGLVTRAYPTDYWGGDRILDERVEGVLSQNCSLSRLELARDSTIAALLRVFVQRSHPALETFAQSENARRIKAFAEQCDALVISHEALIKPFLAAGVTTPSSVLLHNSLGHAAGDMGLRGLFAPAARKLECQVAARPSTGIVVLSRREQAILQNESSRKILFCPPGIREIFASRARSLDTCQLILNGSVEWGVKKRDAKRFITEMERSGSEIPLASEELIADDSTIRIAIITDRFQAGFKLKSADLLCRNTVLISFVDLASDFPDGCRPGLLIRRIDRVSEIPEQIAFFQNNFNQIVAELEQFKMQAGQHLQWNGYSDVIQQSLLTALG